MKRDQNGARARARLGIAAGVVACALALAPAAALADQPQDAWITAKVKMALLTADEVDGLEIDVDTFDRHVTLHGAVETADEKQRAEDEARKIDGVVAVRNLLAVVPGDREQETEVADDEIRTRVEAKLAEDRALAASDLKVVSVNGGKVLLGGEAETLTAHQRALRLARSVDGVQSVDSQIDSPAGLSDRELWWDEAVARGGEIEGETEQALESAERETEKAMEKTERETERAMDEAGETGRSFAHAAGDAWITAKAKVQLMAEPGLSPFNVNVDTRDGVVTLFGTVGSEETKRAAAHHVAKLDGVVRVENELEVAPDVAASKEDVMSDSEIRSAVEQRLATRPALAEAEIGVEVEDGVVTLEGSVASQGNRLEALTAARATRQVRSVKDRLEIRPGTRAAKRS